MATKRQSTLSRIQEIIRAATIDGETIFDSDSVKLSKQPPVNLSTATFPQCFIYSGPETRLLDERAVIGKESWEWLVFLEVWGSDNVLEDLLNAIHSAMFADYKFTNTVEYSERIGVDFQTVDPTMQLESMVIPYRIIYRNAKGNMEE
jgi:hypothetical protein